MERRLREEDFMPDKIASEYKEADRRSGHRFRNCLPHLLSLIRGQRPNKIDIFSGVRAAFAAAASSADSTRR